MRLPAKKKDKVPLHEIVKQLEDNPNITHFDVKMDKNNDTAKINATTSDGSKLVRTVLGAGLSEAYHYDPSQSNVEDRNNSILKLLQRGMRQTEVAQVMGVSQALVSNVKRAAEES